MDLTSTVENLFYNYNKKNNYTINEITASEYQSVATAYFDISKKGVYFRNNKTVEVIIAYSLLKNPYLTIFTSPYFKRLELGVGFEIKNFTENILIPNLDPYIEFLVVKFAITTYRK